MRAFSCRLRKRLQWLCCLTTVCLVCLVVGWSLPADAATRISPQLEQQILQVMREHPEVILESVQKYQQNQQAQIQQAQQTFVRQMKTNPQEVIGESPAIGSSESKVLLVEFSDFQCPYCAQAHETLKQFMAKHKNEVTLVYKHFPLTPIHSQAMPAATAAWAAQQQGKFWEYQDALFTHQKQLGESLYLDIAKNLNLNVEKFQRDRLLADTAIEKDKQLAQSLGVSGTPFFVMNGKALSGALQLAEMENVLSHFQ
ncbi:thioredoxin domain-containing protein [Brasilonema sp. UFV-L1]|uniref:DsbA family protein n=1 Tax=Brasilonema sp. UFV-L1 TaxID=2234130 RepID=UPI00145CFA68|nr:thioredoxin domain-containing protein [Brasilonema sp. UFV-L1]NMG05854.1 disulfide bond formation protein DsbA [Brasilonema sp. UFV-L1]